MQYLRWKEFFIKVQILYLFSLLLCLSICRTQAEAPELPKIVFEAQAPVANRNREIYLMNPDGSQHVNITNHRANDFFPVWSPTGEQILFASDRVRVLDLYLMDADGANVRRVFLKVGERSYPTWSPDGKQIAYQRRDFGQWFIYTATIDGKNEEQVATGSYPTWSPDGSEIAFVTGKLGHNRIWLFNPQTRKQRRLLPEAAIPWMRWPAWSPSGDKIAFCWLNHFPFVGFFGRQTVYIVNRDGTGLRQIVDEAGPRADSPVWSPSGDALLYDQLDENNHGQIFKITLDGGVPKQLTHLKGWSRAGDWFDPAYALSVLPQSQLLTTTWGKVKRINTP